MPAGRSSQACGSAPPRQCLLVLIATVAPVVFPAQVSASYPQPLQQSCTLTPPNLAAAAPFRQCALLGLHLFQGKKRPPEGGGDGGLGRYLHSQSVRFFPTNRTPWAAAMGLAIPSFRLRAPGRRAALVDLEMPNEHSLEWEQKELTMSRERV